MAAYRRYLRELVARKATERADDFASALLAIHDEDHEALSQEDVASILFSLSFAGHETTNYLIGNAVRRLLEDPSRWAALVDDPSLIPGAVDETLRYDPSVPAWRRVTTRPVTLGGVDLPEGAKLFLWLAAAGRDLGKLEAQLALEQLTRRYPDLLLVADQELTFHPNISFRGPQQLWVTTSRDLTRDG
jgi:cytochrome P450